MLNFVRTDDTAPEIASSAPTAFPTEQLDKAGVTASFLCAIHCAIMPFLVTVLPLVGLSFLASEPVEWGLLAASGTLGTLSLCAGFREHKRRRVFAVLGVALALLVAGRIFHHHYHDHSHGHLHVHSLELWSVVFMVLGGFTMMGAHIFNRMLCRSAAFAATTAAVNKSAGRVGEGQRNYTFHVSLFFIRSFSMNASPALPSPVTPRGTSSHEALPVPAKWRAGQIVVLTLVGVLALYYHFIGFKTARAKANACPPTISVSSSWRA
jgi:hypothetical protein